MSVLDNLLNGGQLPTVNVEVTVDDKSVLKLAFAILSVSLIVMFLTRIINK